MQEGRLNGFAVALSADMSSVSYLAMFTGPISQSRPFISGP